MIFKLLFLPTKILRDTITLFKEYKKTKAELQQLTLRRNKLLEEIKILVENPDSEEAAEIKLRWRLCFQMDREYNYGNSSDMKPQGFLCCNLKDIQ